MNPFIFYSIRNQFREEPDPQPGNLKWQFTCLSYTLRATQNRDAKCRDIILSGNDFTRNNRATKACIIFGSLYLLAQVGIYQFWWAGRSNKHDAPGVGGETQMAF